MIEVKELKKGQKQMLIGMLFNHAYGDIEKKPEIGRISLAHSKLILELIKKQASLIKRIDGLEGELKTLKK